MELDKLVVKIEADLKNLKAGLRSANKQVAGSTKGMGNSFKNLGKTIDRVGMQIIKFGSVIGTAFGAYQLTKVVGVGRQIEDLQVRLKALFGTAEEGAKSFQVMLKYASQVPFTLEEIQQGAGNLAIVSKDAEQLKNMLFLTGNVASATGLDFRQTAEQMQRSFSSGIASADVFRERGVGAMLGFQRGAEVSIGETMKAFEKNFGKGGQWGNVTEDLADTMTGTLSMLEDKLFTFRKAVSDEFTTELKKQFQALNKTADESSKELQRVGTAIGRDLARATQTIAENIEEIIFALKALGVFLASVAGIAIIRFIGAMNTLQKSILATIVAYEYLSGVLEKVAESDREAQKEWEKTHKALDLNSKELQDNFKQFSKLYTIMNSIPTTSREITEKFETIIVTEEQMKEITQEVEKTFKDAGEEISDAFGDSIAKGEDFKTAMKSIFQDVVSQIISTITHILIIQPMIEKLSDSLKGLREKGSVTLGGVLSGVGSAVFGDMFKASGGAVMPNTPYVVGEKGAELFVPKQSGTIIPNHQMSSGGVVVNQSLNFSTGVVPTVRAEVMNMMPVIKEETISAVAQSRSRGGSFARTFGA